MSSTEDLRLFIVEDHEITRMGLEMLLADVPNLRVIGHAANGDDALVKIIADEPDVVLMDLGLPDGDGIAVTRIIKQKMPHTRIVILTSHTGTREILGALDAGADGYCLKDVSSSQLIMAIKSVASGASWIHPEIIGTIRDSCARMSRMEQATTPSRQPSMGILSEREIEVMKALSDGLSNTEIADRLAVSAETVKTHMRHIMEKLEVEDRTQAVVKAIRVGIIE